MIEILEPALLTSVQDLGRRGWQAYGVPVSGAMDAFALRAANRLVGNPDGAAVLEVGWSSATIRARSDCLIAVAGAGYDLYVATLRLPLWNSIVVRSGWTIRLEKTGGGNWACLAARGGIRTPPGLGSRSTYTRAQFGRESARMLQAGDRLPVGETPGSIFEQPLRTLPPEARPAYSSEVVAQVIRGPQAERFAPGAWQTFLSAGYRISPTSDRMGYRLTGPTIERRESAEILSEGMARGCVQIPPDGQPIVMQADCPTAGGYPKIAAVVAADQPALAQAPVGAGTVRFAETDILAAQERYRAQIARLDTAIIETDDSLW